MDIKRQLSESELMRERMSVIEGIVNEGSYWGNTGTYEKQARYLESLVPASGAAETQRGEIMRAGSKIYYDYHNNGFGNRWGEALVFLKKYIDLDQELYDWLADYAGGNIHGGAGSSADDEILERLMDATIEGAMETPEDEPRAIDMWDVPVNYDRDFPEDEEEEDDWGYDDEDEDY